MGWNVAAAYKTIIFFPTAQPDSRLARHCTHSVMAAMINLDFAPHSRSASVSSSEHSLSRPHSAHGQRTCCSDLKGPLRPPHARVRASPYLRDPDSVHSSSDDNDDITMYLTPMYPSPDAAHAASAFGRMAISPGHDLDKLASNVRLATTTSASDRAKQIFVQAWCVCFLLQNSTHLFAGSLQIMPPIPTEMSPGRGSTSPTAACATTTASPTSTPLPSARPSVSVSQPSRPAVSASEATANITASTPPSSSPRSADSRSFRLRHQASNHYRGRVSSGLHPKVQQFCRSIFHQCRSPRKRAGRCFPQSKRRGLRRWRWRWRRLRGQSLC